MNSLTALAVMNCSSQSLASGNFCGERLIAGTAAFQGRLIERLADIIRFNDNDLCLTTAWTGAAVAREVGLAIPLRRSYSRRPVNLGVRT